MPVDPKSDRSESDRTRDFLALHSRHGRWIFGYLVSMVRHQADAEDLFSETTVTLWEKFDEFEPGTEFRAWACRIAQLKVLEWRKKHRRVPTPIEESFLEAITDAHLSMNEQLDDQSVYLQECVAELVDEDRDLIQRRYKAGATVKAIATALDRSIHQIYRRLTRVHKTLLKCMRRKTAEDDDR